MTSAGRLRYSNITRRKLALSLATLTGAKTLVAAALPSTSIRRSPFDRPSSDAALLGSAWCIESICFASKAELADAVSAIRAGSHHALLLEAIIAPHVPELVVIRPGSFMHARSTAPTGGSGARRGPASIYELRRYPQHVTAAVLASQSVKPLLRARFTTEIAPHGLVDLFVFDSFEHRNIAWQTAAISGAAQSAYQVAFYRQI